jgi:hypothetical protein
MEEGKKKQKWGHVVATRASTRNHGSINIIEKAKEYHKRKNLENPIKPKGNSFAVLCFDILGDMVVAVSLNIANDEHEKDHIIANMVNKIDRNLVFTSDKPKIVLPLVDIFMDIYMTMIKIFPHLHPVLLGPS